MTPPPFDDDARDRDPLPLCLRIAALMDRLPMARGEELQILRAELRRLEQKVSLLTGKGKVNDDS